jgi:hypothetical protein
VPCLRTHVVLSRGPASATVRATKFPRIEYVFYFVEITSSATVINQMSQMVLLARSKPMTTNICAIARPAVTLPRSANWG